MPGDYLSRFYFLLFIIYVMEKAKLKFVLRTASCKMKTLDESSETQFAKCLKIKYFLQQTLQIWHN